MRINLKNLNIARVFQTLDDHIKLTGLPQQRYWVYEPISSIFHSTVFDKAYGGYGIAAELIHNLRKETVKQLPQSSPARAELLDEIQKYEHSLRPGFGRLYKQDKPEDPYKEDNQHYHQPLFLG